MTHCDAAYVLLCDSWKVDVSVMYTQCVVCSMYVGAYWWKTCEVLILSSAVFQVIVQYALLPISSNRVIFVTTVNFFLLIFFFWGGGNYRNNFGFIYCILYLSFRSFYCTLIDRYFFHQRWIYSQNGAKMAFLCQCSLKNLLTRCAVVIFSMETHQLTWTTVLRC